MFAPGRSAPLNTIGFGNVQLTDDGAALTPLGQHGLGDGDQRYLHHLPVRDPEPGGC